MRSKGLDVLHLSTALTPKDREPIIDEVYKRLERDKATKKLSYQRNWILVATSCAEAGLNFSFRNGFAELRSIQSYLQIDGRVNRNGEYKDSEMWCFIINDPELKTHPGFKTSQKVFKQLIEADLLNKLTITELVTETIKRELKEDRDEKAELILKYERNHEYPEVADICKIIASDTRLVVMDPITIRMLEEGERVSPVQLIKNSVQIWSSKKTELGLHPIKGHEELYRWFENGYDSEFLGYMKAILNPELMRMKELIV
jgi:CRISPR-associated endonuclease/helicase Cas3